MQPGDNVKQSGTRNGSKGKGRWRVYESFCDGRLYYEISGDNGHVHGCAVEGDDTPGNPQRQTETGTKVECDKHLDRLYGKETA